MGYIIAFALRLRQYILYSPCGHGITITCTSLHNRVPCAQGTDVLINTICYLFSNCIYIARSPQPIFNMHACSNHNQGQMIVLVSNTQPRTSLQTRCADISKQLLSQERKSICLVPQFCWSQCFTHILIASCAKKQWCVFCREKNVQESKTFKSS